jgi:hypothetical protein
MIAPRAPRGKLDPLYRSDRGSVLTGAIEGRDRGCVASDRGLTEVMSSVTEILSTRDRDSVK